MLEKLWKFKAVFEIVYPKRKNAVSMCIVTAFVEYFIGLYRLFDIQIQSA